MSLPYRRLLPLVLLSILSACGGGGGGGGGSANPSPPPVVDSDKDGVVDGQDVAPNDPLCSAASDASGGVCYLKSMASAASLKIIGNEAGRIVILADEGTPVAYHYDLNTRHFLGRGNVPRIVPGARFTYSADHARLYVADGDGTIRSYNEAMQETPGVFAKAAAAPLGLQSVGKYLLVRDSSGAWSVYDKQGALAERQDWWTASSHVAWSPALSRVYFFADGQSPNDLYYNVIDQATGKFTSAGETPYHGAYSIVGPIRVSPAGDRVLLGSGDVYAAPELTWTGNAGAVTGQVEWIASGELVKLTPEGAKTRLVRLGSANQRLEEILVDGTVIGLAVAGNGNHMIVKKPTHVEIAAYVPSNDSDGDGVANTVDRFPLDKTAAVDSDNDGYPDAFLPGFGPADSPSGLTLDAYPNDPECYARADGDGTVCNASKAPPAFLPDAILGGDDGVLLMVNRERKRIYRFRPDSKTWLVPVAIGGADAQAGLPTVSRYVAGHNRVYFGYPSGLITYVNLSGDTRETRLSSTAMAVRGLAEAGAFLVAQDDSGAWATHYVFDQQGTLRDSREWNHYSTHYDWNPQQQRLYFYRSDTSPNDVMYEVIDQSSGKITAAGDSPYHGDQPLGGMIRVSPGGTRLYTGAGAIYNTADLTVVKVLGTRAVDARWMANGTLVTLSNESGYAVLRVYDGAFNLLRQVAFVGRPVALFRDGARVIVVAEEVSGKTTFEVVVP